MLVSKIIAGLAGMLAGCVIAISAQLSFGASVFLLTILVVVSMVAMAPKTNTHVKLCNQLGNGNPNFSEGSSVVFKYQAVMENPF